MSLVLSALMSGWVTFINIGWVAGIAAAWLKAFILAWPAAFVISLLLGKPVGRVSAKLSLFIKHQLR